MATKKSGQLKDRDLDQVQGGINMLDETIISSVKNDRPKKPSAGLMNDPADFPVWY